MAIQTAVLGASGYTGQELIRILSGHPQVNLVAVTSRRYAGRPATEIYPSLSGMTTLTYSNATARRFPTFATWLFWPCRMVFPWISCPCSSTRAGKSLIFLPIIVCGTLLLRKMVSGKISSADLFGQAVYGLPELTGMKLNKPG